MSRSTIRGLECRLQRTGCSEALGVARSGLLSQRSNQTLPTEVGNLHWSHSSTVRPTGWRSCAARLSNNEGRHSDRYALRPEVGSGRCLAPSCPCPPPRGWTTQRNCVVRSRLLSQSSSQDPVTCFGGIRLPSVPPDVRGECRGSRIRQNSGGLLISRRSARSLGDFGYVGGVRFSAWARKAGTLAESGTLGADVLG